MKIRATLEFDLENEDGEPIAAMERFRDAAAGTEHAIHARLMGEGFLADDLLVGSWTLNVEVIDDTGTSLVPPG